MSKPNILLVILDSVRAKNTSLHDYPVDTTPNLESLAESATCYTQARSPSIHSIASHASIFSGYHVEEHRLVEHEAILDESESIWTKISDEHDYATGLFTPNVVVSQASNLKDHFEYVVGPQRNPQRGLTIGPDEDISAIDFIHQALTHPEPISSLRNGLYYKLHDPTAHDPSSEHAERYISEFFDWEKEQDGPWAACINLMDAHYPYVANPEFQTNNDKQLRSLLNYFDGPMSERILTDGGWWALESLEYLYDECIKQVDSAVGSLLSGLKSLNQYDNTAIVVTSDHGEAFGEYSQVSPDVRLCDHGWGIHESQTHVPLIVKDHDQSEKEVNRCASSLTEFYNYSLNLINEKEHTFIPEDGIVVSSTYRVPEPGDKLPSHIDKRRYVGPWRAIYENQGEDVIKLSTHGEEGATVRIKSAQDSIVESRDYPGSVDSFFDQLEDAGVNQGNSQMTDEIEANLRSLGYVR